jgi:predicted alpha/beta superfamily hydrolase
MTSEYIELGTKQKIQSKVLDETREILVRLPESYHGTENRYPVLYMLDANFTNFLANDLFAIEYMRFLGKAPEFIIVGVYNTNRDRDMLPIKKKDRGGGGAKKFLWFIEKELHPIINENYRTSGYNILYGASNAGLFGLYALLRNPTLFDNVIAPSPMIGHCPELVHELALKSFKKHSFNNKLYMIYGAEDYPQVTEYVPKFTELLNQNAPEGLRYKVKHIQDEGHVPFTSVYDGLRWLFEKT